MQRVLLERRIRDVHDRLVRVRSELALLDEQRQVVDEDAEEARVRALVAETPQAAHDYSEARRHADALARARRAMVAQIAELENRRDDLLGRVRPASR